MNAVPSSRSDELVFVYNADSGFVAALFDSAHKLFSPSTYDCQLCALTHGLAGPRKQWSAFLKSLDVPMEFIHRDEFRRRFPQLADSTALPAIFRKREGVLTLLLDGARFRTVKSLDALIEFVRTRAAA